MLVEATKFSVKDQDIVDFYIFHNLCMFEFKFEIIDNSKHKL